MPREHRRRKSVVGDLLRRYVQFCVVGGSGVVVDMGVIWFLASPAMLGWNLSLSKVIAAEVAILNNFLWNELWTFRDLVPPLTPRPLPLPPSPSTLLPRPSLHAQALRFLKFNLICTAGIGLSVLLLNAQVYGLGWNVYVSNFIAIVLVSLWNFFLNWRFGWKGRLP